MEYNDKNLKSRVIYGKLSSLRDTIDSGNSWNENILIYDSYDRLMAAKYRRGKMTEQESYVYDKKGRLEQINWKNGSKKFFYYENGLIRKAVKERGKFREIKEFKYE
jgi:hypothetical protein